MDNVRISFVQPLSPYKVQESFNVLGLTFPQLVHDLELQSNQFHFYDANQAHITFINHIQEFRPTHVFLTAITSTFPDAVHCAQIAKENGCITLLGGIFVSMNTTIIQREFPQFDYLVSGKPNHELLQKVQNPTDKPKILIFPRSYGMKKALGQSICSPAFINLYRDGTVCYEITTGCKYSCSFCSIRKAWRDSPVDVRPINTIRSDLALLSNHWSKLKIIDDDFLQSYEKLRDLELNEHFKHIIVETRIDRINPATIQFMKNFGVTCVIFGIEAFDINFIKSTKKGRYSAWEFYANRAIELCISNGITARPVLMLTGPYLDIQYLLSLKSKIANWKPSNHVETLFSFFTPHPGFSEVDTRAFLTNDLSRFDHLNIVYLPEPLKSGDENNVVSIYNELTDYTESSRFNPRIDISREHFGEFECFFT